MPTAGTKGSVELLLAVGVPIRWARGGPIDVVPLLAVAAPGLVTRFVIGARLTPVSFILAATCGSAWALAITIWGIELPTLAAVLTTAVLTVSVERAPPARAHPPPPPPRHPP